MKVQFNIPNKINFEQIEEVADHILYHWQKYFERYEVDFQLQEPTAAKPMPDYVLDFYRFSLTLAISQIEVTTNRVKRLLGRKDYGERDDLLVVSLSPQRWQLAVTVEITDAGKRYRYLVVEWFVLLLRDLAVTFPEIQAEIDRCLLEVEREYPIPSYILPPKGGGLLGEDDEDTETQEETDESLQEDDVTDWLSEPVGIVAKRWGIRAKRVERWRKIAKTHIPKGHTQLIMAEIEKVSVETIKMDLRDMRERDLI